MFRTFCGCLLVLVISVCGCQRTGDSFAQLTDEFVYTSLAFSPVSATQVGYHKHQEMNLDEMLDDYSPASLEEQAKFYRDFRERLTRASDPEALSVQERADYDIIMGQISLTLLELEQIRGHRHNPTLYVELIGNALFNPYVLEYAPKPTRYQHIIARLEKVPALLNQGKGNLTDAPEIWTRVAVEENEGNIGLIDKTLRDDVPEEQREAFERAAAVALDALRSFNLFLKDDLAKRTSDWRLGKELYAQKFRDALGTDSTPEQMLATAEERLREVRKEMFMLSLPLHHKMYPTHKDPVDLNLIVGETLARISDRRSTPAKYFDDANRDLEEARDFVRAKGLLPLPPRDNLQVIETPEFMRGIYAVGGFAPAPALEPQLGAFYWITPIPPDWSAARIESKLREYNFYKLKLLTIHEAMPGHYVQLEYANDVEPQTRRVLRSVFGNMPYIEGWAQYATQVMLDEGYLDGAPELRLTFLKEELRVLANAIIDVRLQTMGMTDQEALDLMEKQTFQENEEATAKLRRAKLSSCQLPTYYVGWRDWLRVRDEYRTKRGDAFNLSEFHERALKAGSVPMRVLASLLELSPEESR